MDGGQGIDGTSRRLVLIRPRGFCAGVVRAVDAVWLALERFGPPIYVRHEIVHNEHVLRELGSAGAVFVDELDEVPTGARVFFSAHGVSPAVRDEAKQRGLLTIDATCPLVSKVHQQAIRLDRQGFTILLIGHRAHVEVAGTSGEAPRSTIVISSVEEAEAVVVADPDRVGYLTQTTLSMADVADIVSALRRRFPALKEPASQDICYATENRQTAVQAVAERCDVILVVGSNRSSNSLSLVETARRAGVRSALVPDPEAVPWAELADAGTVGLTSGASTPDALFHSVVERLERGGFALSEEVEVVHETMTFALPPGLTDQGRETGREVVTA
jgi:4-hydroxy-3-methylbut-2-enyl diphosphate reductase